MLSASLKTGITMLIEAVRSAALPIEVPHVLPHGDAPPRIGTKGAGPRRRTSSAHRRLPVGRESHVRARSKLHPDPGRGNRASGPPSRRAGSGPPWDV